MSAFGILLFVLAIIGSIGLHEFGHFIAAKRFGIKVEQFFIGFGPRLWSIRRGETEYGVKAFPLGGYVRIAGMNPFEEVAPEDHDRVFKARKPWQRAIVLGAGSFTHFVLAAGLIAGILAIPGIPDPDRPTTTVRAISATLDGEPSPAVRAGIREGDRVLAIDGVAVTSWNEAVDLIHDRPAQTVPVKLQRRDQILTVSATIADHKPDGTKVGFLGVGPEFVIVRRNPAAAVVEAGRQIGTGVKASILAFGDIFSPSTIRRLFSVAAGNTERSAEDPATVVGIGGQAGGLARRGDFAGLFYLFAGFNIFIGVANLLPLPPLDGGHLAVLAFEKASGRTVDMRRLIPLTAAVISLFGSLFMLLLYLDIVRPLPPIPG
jgi:membrane-associated protease RseP (regulator of RpoE activity)